MLMRNTEPSEEQVKAFKEKINGAIHSKYDNAKEADADMAMLLFMLKNGSDFKADNNDDNTFHFNTANGNTISVSATNVGANLFAKGPSDSYENIVAAIEMTIAAKAAFEGDAAYLGGEYSAEEMQIMVYAADKVGFTMVNRPENIEIPDDLKKKMDDIWDGMKKTPGMEASQPIVDHNQTITASM